MRIIGDVHTKIAKYAEIISTCKESIQVGDFGLQPEWDWLEECVSLSHKINMGNHDFIPYINKSHSLGNWSYERGIFTVRGAYSIDFYNSREGLDWFRNEELNYGESNEVYENWMKIKPEIVVTHDCPASVAEKLFGFPTTGINKDYFKSTTRELLQSLFEEHQPKIWIFGHYHKSKDEVINGTRFICLAELEYLDL
jgi:Icc-related predicted phosphoesterase